MAKSLLSSEKAHVGSRKKTSIFLVSMSAMAFSTKVAMTSRSAKAAALTANPPVMR